MSSVSPPCIFIVVLNWNGWKDTNECIRSLKKLDYPNFRILVVDNASTDGSVNKIRNQYPGISILQTTENKGYAGGNNEGIRYAMANGADYIWILNNDTVAAPGALRPLVEKMEKNSQIGICGSLLKDYHHREQIQGLGGGCYYKWLGVTHPIIPQSERMSDYNTEHIEKSLDYIWGASMFVSKAFINSVGLMNEEYFLYYEEIDWAVRGKKDYKLGFAPESIVYHKLNASIDSGKKENEKRSETADYYQTKNRLKFTQKYFAYCLPTVYLTVIYAFIKRLLKGQGSRAVMIFKLMFTFYR